MLLHLTDLSSEPLQGQIIRQIRAHILSGELAASTALPSIRELARNQHVSVITVQRAYEALLREGLIHSRRGKGFFVSELKDNEKIGMARERLRDTIGPLIVNAAEEGLSRKEILETVELILKRNGKKN